MTDRLSAFTRERNEQKTQVSVFSLFAGFVTRSLVPRIGALIYKNPYSVSPKSVILRRDHKKVEGCRSVQGNSKPFHFLCWYRA